MNNHIQNSIAFGVTFLRHWWLLVVTLTFVLLVLLTDHAAWAAMPGAPANQTAPPVLTIQKVGNGAVVANPPGPSYTVGQVVTLTATADFGWNFVNWSGDLNSATNPATLAMTSDKTVQATFAAQAASTITSDDFNTCSLKPKWTFTDPVGDGKLVTTGEQVELQIPAGVGHDVWSTGNRAPRLMQPANNVDFEIEVKFETPVTQRFQLQGVLIEGDAQNFLRINFQSDGSKTTLAGYSFTSGAPTLRVDQPVPDGAPLYLRIRRTSNLWKLSYSTNGSTWNSSAAFEFAQALTVTKVGVFAGNAGENPAFTAVVDYFFNTASPIAPEDPVKNTVPVNVVGKGVVTKSCGNPLTLTAKPDLGWKFSGWSGSLNSTQNPTTLALSGSQVVTATFVPKPLQLTVNANGSGSVLLNPNQLFFDNGELVTLTAVADSGWTFVNWAGDLTGSEIAKSLVMTNNKTVVANFRLLSDTSGVQSDDFNQCALNSGRWSFVDPVGDAKLTMTGAQAQIAVPDGVDHDVWTAGNRAPRLMQAAANTDFELEAKFESSLEKRYQFQGILVEGDASNFIRFNFQYDGADVRIVAISFTGGAPSVRVDKVITNGAPLYMRVLRAGHNWSLYYSYNGVDWITDKVLTFTYQLTVTKVGVFAGNAGANPAFTSLIDYFFNTATPITPEDPVVNTFPPITVVGAGTVTRNPACGNPTTLTANPAPNWQFAGWSGDLTTTANPILFTANGQEQITATFVPLSGFYSDDFNACALDTTVWSFVDPKNDATLMISDGQQLEVSIPAGVEHDISPIPNSPLNRAPRLMQAVNNVDFELETKFASDVRRQYQIQGMLIEQDSENFLRFDFDHDGNSPKLLAMSYVNGAPTTLRYDAITGSAPWYMRVNRTGDLWTLLYSTDGLNWTTGVTVTRSLIPTQAGIFVGNAGGNPAHTAIVDYFFETSAPITPEDGKPIGLTTTVVGGGQISKTPEQSSYGCNTEVELQATAAAGWVFSGWSGAITGDQNPAKLTIDSQKIVTATFTQQVYQLAINISGAGSVSRNPSQTTYLHGDTVTLTAQPVGNETFVRWEGDLSSTANPITLTMNGNKSVTAVFTQTAPTAIKLYLPIVAK